MIAMGMPMSVLKAEGIFEKVIAIKYDVPNDNLQFGSLPKQILMISMTQYWKRMHKEGIDYGN